MFSAKTHPGPAAATTRPPTAGPTARARFMLTPLSAAACGSIERCTRSGWIACHDGPATALPHPRTKVSPSTTAGDVYPAKVRAVSVPAASSMASWAASSSRRRSTRSARAPDGSASRTTGRLIAVCTSDTRTGEVSIRSHCAPTVCIQVPTLDANCAIQSARNTGEDRRGAQGDAGPARAGAGAGGGGPAAASPPARASAMGPSSNIGAGAAGPAAGESAGVLIGPSGRSTIRAIRISAG